MDLLNKLAEINRRWEDIGEQLGNPEVASDMKRFVQMNKDYKELEPIVEAYKKYKALYDNVQSAKEMLELEKDEEMREFAKEELSQSEEAMEAMEEEIKLLLIPKDPEDQKNAIVEIRAGTGGDEASIFAGDLYRMYTKYCLAKGWKTELMDSTEGTAGGFKEIIFKVATDGAYGELKYEAGVHRVQRVPQTETQGRVHTSAASVVVMPEADEFDVEINMNDIRKDVFCSSGPGGQSVNTTYSAIRLTHIPTGIVASCQDQKSQIKNFEKALSVLRSRIYEVQLQEHLEQVAGKRKTMVSTGDRSAKIRTYNYPQSRITDHRIGLTLYNLTNFMEGDIQEVIDALKLAENTERLKEGETI